MKLISLKIWLFDLYERIRTSYWPVCFCDDCIRCGCNLPWKHHTKRSGVITK